jgi:hypothetical protein
MIKWIYKIILAQLDAAFPCSTLSLRRLDHAYNAMVKLKSITNAVVTSFVVRVVELLRDSQSVGSDLTSPSAGICWLR